MSALRKKRGKQLIIVAGRARRFHVYAHREGLHAGFQVSAAAEAHVQLRPALAPPQGESRSDTWIVFELARRLGLADRFFGGDAEAGLTQMLAPTGLTPEALRAAPGGLSLALETRYQKI